ncbi:MAG: DUF5011 domain-containing protein, partial [Bacilli bacterium]|nr:DUF5011 domain-containing protein [Bacilli bacterium]
MSYVSRKNNNSNSSLLIIVFCFLFIIGIIIVSYWVGISGNEKTYTLSLNGDSNVILYKGNVYNDPGAIVVDENNNDLSNQVLVDNRVNVNQTGNYEIIYSFGDISVKRVVKVIEKPKNPEQSGSDNKKGETKITLKGSETVYIDLYGNYKEEGFSAIDSVDGNIKKNVKVTHNVDNKTPGVYEVVYSVKNSAGVTTTAKRNIIVMDLKINLSLINTNYTNSSVGIKIDITDEYFDYVILPDGTKSYEKSSVYNVSTNGTYKFTLVNKHGASRIGEIKIENIDKTPPTASCSAEFKNGKTIVTVNAKDNIGIASYVVNGKTFSSNIISLDSLVVNNTVYVYDYAGNMVQTSCIVNSKVYIESVKKDGVIITVKAGNINSTIAGYYFNYTNSVPDKSSGKFIATSNNIIDIVRLPGNSYIWVEDTNGNISEVCVINISNDALLITSGSNYSKLENMSLDEYLSRSGWSKAEYDKLIARSVRAAGIYSKEAAATAGVAMQTVLAQKYKIKLPYWWGGKSWEYGADKSWGIYKTKYSDTY